MAGSRHSVATGFAAVARADARVLVLGSLPGRRSIDAGEYYAHPQNAFWRIMQDLFGIPRGARYGRRLSLLADRRVALWDVLHASRRRGSLDAAIDTATAEVNDFATLFSSCPELQHVFFNGKKAAQLFRSFVEPALAGAAPRALTLPSTSAAHAAMPYRTKLRHWTAVRDAAAR